MVASVSKRFVRCVARCGHRAGRRSRDVITPNGHLAALELLPRLARAVGAAVARAGGVDLRHELLVLDRPGRGLPGSVRVVRAHRHVQHAADRLDPEDVPPLLDVAGHRRRFGSRA